MVYHMFHRFSVVFQIQTTEFVITAVKNHCISILGFGQKGLYQLLFKFVLFEKDPDSVKKTFTLPQLSNILGLVYGIFCGEHCIHGFFPTVSGRCSHPNNSSSAFSACHGRTVQLKLKLWAQLVCSGPGIYLF